MTATLTSSFIHNDVNCGSGIAEHLIHMYCSECLPTNPPKPDFDRFSRIATLVSLVRVEWCTIEKLTQLRYHPRQARTMSAPQQGRQSPEPEQQSGKQVNSPPASNPNNQGQANYDAEPAEKSKDQLKNLDSNPKHILEEQAKEKTK